ncbi:NAD-dependent succinate-semialdehyde dehydrogenase [Brevibacterium aurantiacum]|uniref:NAD-dependent succinate-semialdehyde dehydrogenase n=1 Tax=Brevibacterium aurantiacum TaxID=273384 RepID=A0A1D7W765_BREAU|nr:NAD-dependent succinate-semialdehyde dehydrogenase [Brevibacterium aurantiacum]MDN5593764.1 NAD-dependent succinate-semialdehyde dehydrogenase [Brevibacterium sp.]AOP54897.1 Succinate-semialdehyde dehydrogenase [NAD(P)+] [Brevibacterium aurantiacum]AZL06836.1 NAD-dependent succinate-semialdehyde dehydrogenase [Brevibacterium aurantiacum]AZT94599.1 NAD-dependent succinate-semialdehyde dehydrogenase [Brevibacterium aurantiacum]MDN5607172.1 NAD-dependent succinate-semialdehyde dehydrogenase [B
MDIAPIIDKLNTGLFINGQWREAEGGKTIDVLNPATGDLITTVADGTAADAAEAIKVAGDTQESWAATPPRERAEILRRAFELLIERADDIAAVMTAEMGKPFAESKGEVTYGAEFFRWFSEEAVRVGGEYTQSTDGKTRVMVSREPVGPCILITPWNFPLAMGTRKIGPAIAAGCTMVFKPAKLTPLTSLMLVDVLVEAGLPAGVLNVVTSESARRVVTPWMESGIARKVTFTGSTEVGIGLLKQAADNVMKTSMELGGNAPFVVCDDADIDKAVTGAVQAKMRNGGEACTSANRLFVHSSIAEEFSTKLTERIGSMTVGNGLDEGTEVGPLVDQDSLDKVASLVDDAVSKGAKVLTGGSKIEGKGFFYSPTVMTDVPLDSEIRTTEIFGPVAPIVTFDTDEEGIALANETEFGLAGYLFSENVERALNLADKMQVGMVGLNTGLVSNPAAPFGGVKKSGLGREGGSVGIEEFLEVKYVALPRA